MRTITVVLIHPLFRAHGTMAGRAEEAGPALLALIQAVGLAPERHLSPVELHGPIGMQAADNVAVMVVKLDRALVDEAIRADHEGARIGGIADVAVGAELLDLDPAAEA